MIKNIIKHTVLVTKHKWWVFKLCCRIGLPWRGLIHDLSKFSPTEFFEAVKYYQGNRSHIPIAREVEGYSKAWLHHKGRNKHHLEYWVDSRTKIYAAIIPYKYLAEMACDKMAASIVYGGKQWTNSSQIDYWMKHRNTTIVNPKVDHFLTKLFEQVRDEGLEKTYTKKNFKALYKKYCIDDKTEYRYEVNAQWKVIDK